MYTITVIIPGQDNYEIKKNSDEILDETILFCNEKEILYFPALEYFSFLVLKNIMLI